MEKRAQVGALVNVGDIKIERHAMVAQAISGGTVTLEKGASVGQVVSHAVLTPLAKRSISVPNLVGAPADFTVGNGSSVTLAPGPYRKVEVEDHATLTLSAGIYEMESFNLERFGDLMLDTSAGSVTVYVRQSGSFDGTESGDAANFLYTYLGTQTLRLKSNFRGTALAPSGTLDLSDESPAGSGSTPGVYHGTFYGKDVIVDDDVTVVEVAPPLLIDNLAVSKTTLCVGEETEVNIDTSAVGPGATTWINGTTVGNHQFVQFGGFPGVRLVSASVNAGNGNADFQSVQVLLQKCAPAPGQAPPVALRFGAALSKPNVVEFSVHGYDADGKEGAPPLPSTFAWSFGDGQTMTTTTPLVDHDYAASVKPMDPYSFFNVSVTVTSSAGTATAQKEVPLFSLYALNRSKGIIQPPNSLTATASTLTLAVTNYEPAPLVITQANIELVPCDPALDAVPQTPQPLSVTIPATTTATVNVPPPGPFSPTVCGYGIHLLGTSSAGKVFTDAYAQVAENPLLKKLVTDPKTIALLNQASALTANPNKFGELELGQLVARGLLSGLPPAIPPGTTYQSIGDECNPGDTPPNHLDMVCQPTADWVVIPSEYLNAYKGQFVMEHGCGPVGQLLKSINQTFSHAGVMTKNRVEIRHSTASQDRVNGSIQINNATARLDPNKLKYAFPGTGAPVTVDQIVHSYCISDPAGAHGDDPSCPSGWTLSGELNPSPEHCNGTDGIAVPPIVVRSIPDAPLSTVQGIASVATTTTGRGPALTINSHYRFDEFSHADQPHVGPTSSGIADWAIGTIGTVSSSYPRLAAFNAGLSLWPNRPNPGLPDGMRPYSVSERRMAGDTLNSNLRNQVSAQCDPVLGALFGLVLPGGPILGATECAFAISNISNQIVNCFASDSCEDTSSAWENPGPGVAVSEDDITRWDTATPTPSSPTGGGTYGYNEALVYLPASFRHKYAWFQQTGSESMIVKVVNPDGSAFPMADVIVDGDIRGTTDSMGILQIAPLAPGSYDVEAQRYTGPPLPPPQPPPLDDVGIVNLPDCPAQPGCKVSQSASCPDGWLRRNCAQAECIDLFPGQCTPIVDCECYPPIVPPATCQLQHAGRSAVVSAGQTAMVTLTLCPGDCDAGLPGLPPACPTRCDKDEDCGNSGLVCDLNPADAKLHFCVPAPRLVKISSPPSEPLFILCNALGLSPPFSTAAFENPPLGPLTCDPTKSPPGNTVTEPPICNQDKCELHVSVTCQPDLVSPGGITLTEKVQLLSGCGSNAHVVGGNSLSTTIVDLPPPGPSNPTPSIVLDNPGASSCFTELLFPFTPSNPCQDNDALVDMQLTSVAP